MSFYHNKFHSYEIKLITNLISNPFFQLSPLKYLQPAADVDACGCVLRGDDLVAILAVSVSTTGCVCRNGDFIGERGF